MSTSLSLHSHSLSVFHILISWKHPKACFHVSYSFISPETHSAICRCLASPTIPSSFSLCLVNRLGPYKALTSLFYFYKYPPPQFVLRQWEVGIQEVGRSQDINVRITGLQVGRCKEAMNTPIVMHFVRVTHEEFLNSFIRN